MPEILEVSAIKEEWERIYDILNDAKGDMDLDQEEAEAVANLLAGLKYQLKK